MLAFCVNTRRRYEAVLLRGSHCYCRVDHATGCIAPAVYKEQHSLAEAVYPYRTARIYYYEAGRSARTSGLSFRKSDHVADRSGEKAVSNVSPNPGHAPPLGWAKSKSNLDTISLMKLGVLIRQPLHTFIGG